MQKRFSVQLGLSLLAAVMFVGCGGKGDFREVNEQDLVPMEDHHHHAAPHGGLLIELGNHQYNAEFVVAETAPRLTIYVLDAHAENPVAVSADAVSLVLESAEAPLKLNAVPQDGEAEGTSSRFEAAESLPETIKTAQDLKGNVTVKIKDKEYKAALKSAEGHDHKHDHDHDHKHDKK